MTVPRASSSYCIPQPLIASTRTAQTAWISLFAGMLCLAVSLPADAQTKKPTWSAQRPTAKQHRRPPVRRNYTAPANRPKSNSPKKSLSSTLLAPQDANRKSFVPTPRTTQNTTVAKSLPPIATKRAHPAPTEVAAAQTAAFAPPRKTTQLQLQDSTTAQPRPAPQHDQPRQVSQPTPAPTTQSPAARDSKDRVANAQHFVPVRKVATSRSAPHPLVLRSAEMPTLRTPPRSKLQRKRERPSSNLPNVRQPGSLRLVQFEDSLAQSDDIDFDSPDLFAEPQAASPPADAPAPTPATNLFDNDVNTTQPAEVEPTESLFQDNTPEPIVTPEPAATEPPRFDEPAATNDLFGNRVPESRTSATGMAPNQTENGPKRTFSQSGKELQAEIESALENNPALPTLPGEEPPAPDDGETERPLDNLFGDDGEAEAADPGRDLSSTNGRDTRKAKQACIDEMAFLRRRERTDMSVDITPSIEPREFDMTKVEQTRVEKLAKSPPITWTDRSGQVIADGTFEDYRNGKVTVRTVNGTMRTIPDYKLSNENRSFVNAWWELPDECHFEDEQFVMRDFRLTTFTWTAAATCHKPLYFEEVGLERYGHTAGPIVQPIVSGVHFFGNVVMMPYHMGLTPPNECVYPLGYYRPGDCAPWIVRGFPMTTRGFKWQAFALGAGIALLP